MSTITGVTAADETPTPTSGSPLGGDAAGTGRLGDRLFGGMATGAGGLVVALVTLIGVFLLWQAIPSLAKNEANFLTSREWVVAGDHPRFGIVELLWTTVASSMIAMALAVPVGVGVALFITQYAPRWLSRPAASLVDLLAAVPSIVYGLWGVLTFRAAVRPVEDFLQSTLGWFPLFSKTGISGGTIFFIGIVLAIMVLPIVTALSREVFAQTPIAHKEGALALGATRWEMIRMAVLPYARSGIISAVMLGLGRALGETMAVTFVIGNAYKISSSLFQPGNSIASALANEFTEAVGALYTSALIELGLILFLITTIVLACSKLLLLQLARGEGARA